MHFIFTGVTRTGGIEEGMEQSPYTSFKQINSEDLSQELRLSFLVQKKRTHHWK